MVARSVPSEFCHRACWFFAAFECFQSPVRDCMLIGRSVPYKNPAYCTPCLELWVAAEVFALGSVVAAGQRSCTHNICGRWCYFVHFGVCHGRVRVWYLGFMPHSQSKQSALLWSRPTQFGCSWYNMLGFNVPWRVFFRVEDYWRGYKLFCYAYYSNSAAHESEFRDCKLGELQSSLPFRF